MNFYRRRPLALILSLCIVVFAAAVFMPLWMKLAAIVLVCALCVLMLTIAKRQRLRTICNMPSGAFICFGAALILCSMLMSLALYDVHLARISSLKSGEARMTVTDVKSSSSYCTLYEVRMHECNSEKYSAKGLLYSELALSLSIGDSILTNVEFVPLGDFYNFGDSSRISLLADGYVFTADTVSNVTVLSSSKNFDTFFSGVRNTIGAKLSLYLGREELKLVKGIFLGKRDDMGLVGRDFTYSGTLHILALSGMHLSMLASSTDRFMHRFRVPKKIRFPVVAAILAIYIAMTGFPVSVVRAGTMLAVYFGACALHSDADRVSALFLAVWLIILQNPAAVYDIGLQLSFFATLGVILMDDREPTPNRLFPLTRRDIVKDALSDLYNLIAVSLGAVFFVMPLQWIYFGEASTMSVAATILLSVLCEWLLMLLLPYLILIILEWHFAAAVISGFIDAVCEFITHTVHFFADKATLVWLGYPFTLPIMVCTAAIILYMAARGVPKWKYSLIPLCAACAVFFMCVHICGKVNAGTVTIDYATYGENDAVLFMVGSDGTVIDCSDGSASALSMISGAIRKRGETELDTLVLTELTRRHLGTVRRMLGARRVTCILFPEPDEEYELFLAADLVSIAAEYGTEATTYSKTGEFCELDTSKAHLTFAPRAYLTRSERELLAFSIEASDVNFTYAGACSWENDIVWSLTEDADYLVIGRHGPTIKSGPSAVPASAKRLIFISPEDAGVFTDWLSGYSGSVRRGDSFSLIIKP